MTHATRIPLEFWQRHRVLPLEEDGQRFTVGVHAGMAREVLEDIRLAFRKDVRPVVMSVEEVEDGLRRLVVE